MALTPQDYQLIVNIVTQMLQTAKTSDGEPANPVFKYVKNYPPTIDVNPDCVNCLWLDTTTGVIYVCIDNTPDNNIWAGTDGSLIFKPFVVDVFNDKSCFCYIPFDLSIGDLAGVVSTYLSIGNYSFTDGYNKLYAFDFYKSCILVNSSYFYSSFAYRSYTFFMKPRDVESLQVIFNEGGSVNGLSIGIVNKQLFFGGYTNRKVAFLSVDISNYLNQWIHVVCVFDGGTQKIYINGQLANSNTAPYSYVGSHSDYHAIGGVYSYTRAPENIAISRGYYYNGLLDEFRIFNKALTDEEVLWLYENPQPTGVMS